MTFDFLAGTTIFIEIGPNSWRVADETNEVELPVERTEQGGLSEAGRDRLLAGLKAIVNKKSRLARSRALVAIGARGVSLRRLNLPVSAGEELEGVLRLQMESAFPLPPDELAWGWQVLGQNAGRQDMLLAAVRKDALELPAKILLDCNITPVFTVAALARNEFLAAPEATCAVLHAGHVESELHSLRDGAPDSVRVVPKNSANLKAIPGKIYLTGPAAREPHLAGVGAVLGTGLDASCSLAIAGLKKFAASGSGVPPLVLGWNETRAVQAKAMPWPWVAVAALLLLGLCVYPYAEAVVLQPHLARKLAATEADRTRLPTIDRELDFLQYLKRSQPPYLDTIYLIAKLAPSGTSFESVTMNRKGDFAIKGTLGSADQVTEFRSSLIKSAWFSSVTVEEQTPGQNRQVTVRMTAQVKPVDARKPIPDEPPAKTEKN